MGKAKKPSPEGALEELDAFIGEASTAKKAVAQDETTDVPDTFMDGPNPVPLHENAMKFEKHELRVLAKWTKDPVSFPPEKSVVEQFSGRAYPECEQLEYLLGFQTKEGGKLMTDIDEDLKHFRRAAEAHRQVRQYAQEIIRPGMKLIDIAHLIEANIRRIIGGYTHNVGHGFPCGLSINNVAAHDSPNYGDTRVLQFDDIMKVDYGCQVEGRLIDSAFSVAFNESFDPLLMATKDATNTALKKSGIDVRVCDIGADVAEVISSYEVEIRGKTVPIRPVENLNGHLVGPYEVHAGKSVPLVDNGDETRMEEGEVFALETFATTGRGFVRDDGECSHYMKNKYAADENLKLKSAAQLHQAIKKQFGTFAFCRRWLDDLGHKRHAMSLKHLCDQKIVRAYPPLADVRGSYVSQFEHTVMLKPNGKEVLSRGDDY